MSVLDGIKEFFKSQLQKEDGSPNRELKISPSSGIDTFMADEATIRKPAAWFKRVLGISQEEIDKVKKKQQVKKIGQKDSEIHNFLFDIINEEKKPD